MSRYEYHRTLPVAEILRQHRFAPNDPMVLDNANDAWLNHNGTVSERYARLGVIGRVPGHLAGAARVSAALRIVRDYRAMGAA